jgi:hypothetical protein
MDMSPITTPHNHRRRVRHKQTMWVLLVAGRDHVIFFSGDWGVCEFFPQSPPDLQNMIHLTFWGLKTQRRGLYLDRGPCYNPDKDIVLPPIQVLQPFRLFVLPTPSGVLAEFGQRTIDAYVSKCTAEVALPASSATPAALKCSSSLCPATAVRGCMLPWGNSRGPFLRRQRQSIGPFLEDCRLPRQWRLYCGPAVRGCVLSAGSGATSGTARHAQVAVPPRRTERRADGDGAYP